MSWFEITAERKIRDAQEEGVFDNLPGKGKPLNLELDLRVPPEQRMAYRLMREANVLPEWIQLDKDVRARLEQWDARVEQFVRDRERELERRPPSRERDAYVDNLRDRFLLRSAEGLRELNRLIDRLNLAVPTLAQQRLRIMTRERMQELEDRFPRLGPSPKSAPAWEAILREDRPPIRMGNRLPLRRRKSSIG